MKITVYDHSFNSNEWFILIVFAIGYLLLFMCPKRFTGKESIFYLLFGIFTGKFFDHTISIDPFNFYDVNDTSGFQIMDFLSYLMFGPVGYFFVYLYDKFQLNRWMTIVYILIWSFVALGVEYIAHILGVYHYKNGYHLFFSLPIYLISQTVLIWFYYQIRVRQKETLSN